MVGIARTNDVSVLEYLKRFGLDRHRQPVPTANPANSFGGPIKYVDPEALYTEHVVPTARSLRHPALADFVAQGWKVCVLACPRGKCADLCPVADCREAVGPVRAGCQRQLQTKEWKARLIFGYGGPHLLVYEVRRCEDANCPGKGWQAFAGCLSLTTLTLAEDVLQVHLPSPHTDSVRLCCSWHGLRPRHKGAGVTV